MENIIIHNRKNFQYGFETLSPKATLTLSSCLSFFIIIPPFIALLKNNSNYNKNRGLSNKKDRLMICLYKLLNKICQRHYYN